MVPEPHNYPFVVPVRRTFLWVMLICGALALLVLVASVGATFVLYRDILGAALAMVAMQLFLITFSGYVLLLILQLLRTGWVVAASPAGVLVPTGFRYVQVPWPLVQNVGIKQGLLAHELRIDLHSHALMPGAGLQTDHPERAMRKMMQSGVPVNLRPALWPVEYIHAQLAALATTGTPPR